MSCFVFCKLLTRREIHPGGRSVTGCKKRKHGVSDLQKGNEIIECHKSRGCENRLKYCVRPMFVKPRQEC